MYIFHNARIFKYDTKNNNNNETNNNHKTFISTHASNIKEDI